MPHKPSVAHSLAGLLSQAGPQSHNGAWGALALEAPELMKYNDSQVLFDNRDAIWNELQAVIRTRSNEEWIQRMLERDLWMAEVKTQAEVADDPQVRHVEGFTEIEHPAAGKVTVTNIPIDMSETPGRIRLPAPMIGQHGREILEESGYTSEAIDQMLEDGVLFIQ